MKTKFLRHGSVKDIWETDQGHLLFSFSDRFSVFDWGQMPETIPGKGASLFHCARTFFRLLTQHNISHHVIKYHQDKFEVQKFTVPKILDQDYSVYKKRPTNILVPLECIFRFESFKTKEKFQGPVINFTTKQEAMDRSIPSEEAKIIAGLNEKEFQDLNKLILEMAHILKNFLSDKELTLIDGKFEFALNADREFVVVDSFGPDEWRVRGVGSNHLSKEFLRQYYRDSSWFVEIQDLKNQHGADWKKYTPKDLKPPILPLDLQQNASSLYRYCQELMTLPKNSVVVLGNGGREHALALSLSQSIQVDEVCVIPGNPGMNSKLIKTYPEVNVENFNELNTIFNIISPTLIIPGPEKLLAAGVVNEFNQSYTILGPTKEAAMIESSKAFAKNLMEKYLVPTAPYKVVSDYGAALPFIDSYRDGVVVKMDGLCAGKGVLVCADKEVAKSAVVNMLPGTLVLEKKISGREVSVLALCTPGTFKILGYVCDHKRLRDGDLGPNTGGMGCYTPHIWPSENIKNRIEEAVFARILQGMEQEQIPFSGILFAGLMIDGDEIQVLEFNARLGDPETQTLLPLIKNDLYLEFLAAAKGKLLNTPIKISQQYGLTVVLTSPGYAETTMTEHLKLPSFDLLTFYAGVKSSNNELISQGGRVLSLFSRQDSLEKAREEIYGELKKSKENPFHYRNDIGAVTYE
jgi:phosphoribosylaminoimidazole-succinocarboxamide synthase